jgi:Flp pilus assembly protein TadG
MLMRLNRWLRDRRGSAAVEFAFVAPLMILLYCGLAEVTQALLTDRRVSQVSSAVGDLVAQSSKLSEDEIDNIFDISTALLRPSPTTELGIRVASVSIDARGVASVQWTQSRGKVGTLPGPLANIPPDLLKPNESLVRTDTTYLFDSPIKQALPDAMRFNHVAYLKPRNAAAVERTTN